MERLQRRFPPRHPLAAVPTLAPPQHHTVGQQPNIHHPEVLAAAGPANQPGLLPVHNRFALSDLGHYRLLLCNSDSRRRGRGGSFGADGGLADGAIDELPGGGEPGSQFADFGFELSCPNDEKPHGSIRSGALGATGSGRRIASRVNLFPERRIRTDTTRKTKDACEVSVRPRQVLVLDGARPEQ